MAIVAGQKIRASDLNTLGARVGRNRRTTNSAAVTANTRIISVTAPVVAGRTYRVTFMGEIVASVGAATSQVELRYTTDNTEPTLTSPILDRAVVRHDSTTSVPDTVAIIGEFISSTTTTLRVALCLQRVAGTVAVFVTADATYPATLTVDDAGPTIPTTGTVY